MKNTFTKYAGLMLVCLTAASTAIAGPDISTPKKAAVALAKALQAGDMTAAKTLATGNDTEWALLKSMSDTMLAAKNLSDAAAAKWGDQGKLPPGMEMNLAADFDGMDEKIDGDKAVLINKAKPDDKFPPTLKKTSAGWIMDLSNMDADPSTAQMAQMLPMLTKAFNAVATNIKAGKYASLQEALMAMQGEMGPPPGAPAAPAPAPAQ